MSDLTTEEIEYELEEGIKDGDVVKDKDGRYSLTEKGKARYLASKQFYENQENEKLQ